MWIRWKAVTLGVLAGGAAAAVLYSSLAPGASPIGASIPIADVAPSVTYADCVPPAQLEGGDCVTHVTVTKTVPAPVAAPAEMPAAAPEVPSTVSAKVASAPAPAPVVSRSDDDHGDDHDDDHGDDHGDDGSGEHDDD